MARGMQRQPASRLQADYLDRELILSCISSAGGCCCDWVARRYATDRVAGDKAVGQWRGDGRGVTVVVLVLTVDRGGGRTGVVVLLGTVRG